MKQTAAGQQSAALWGVKRNPGRAERKSSPCERQQPLFWNTPPQLKIQPQKHRSLCSTASASAGFAAIQVSSAGLPVLLSSAGLFLLGLALAVIAVASVPAILEARKTAKEMQQLLRALEREIPDTASTLRLTGLEMSDAIQEVTLLSNDVTKGLQASTRMLQDAEGGVKQGVEFVRATAANKVLPAIRARMPTARGVIEERLRLISELSGSSEALLQLATATRVTARRLRFALVAADLMGRARAVSTFLSSRALHS